MALFGILVGIVIVTMNPDRQFASARNSTRFANLNTIMSAISANMAENNGVFTCATGDIPAADTNMSNVVPGYDISPCLVTNYLPSMPYDPSGDGAHWTTVADYDTGYDIAQDADGRITLTARHAELEEAISVTR